MPDNNEDHTSLVTTYVVNKTSQYVTLTLIVGGPGQTATSLVVLDETELLLAHPGDIFDYQIGKNKDLGGRTLKIVTTVTDTAENHNHTELIIRLKGGVIFREYPLSKEVNDNGSAVYNAEITFFSF